MTIDSVALAQKLIQFPSLNPPGQEKACIEYLAALLSKAGFDVAMFEFAPERPSLVARIVGTGPQKPLCFTGHVDVVPLGAEVWKTDPFAGGIRDGKLFGRGASDMKAGVAAFVAATVGHAEERATFKRGVTLVITAGEETGCLGAFHLVKLGVLGSSALLIVAEPSSNLPIIAHKGSLRLSVSSRGQTAHSSMPELGDNAISKVVGWIQLLNVFEFKTRAHPLLGKTTACVTTIFGGENINSVPDSAGFTVDFRTIPDHLHANLIDDMNKLWGPRAKIEIVTDFKGFSTAPDDPAILPLMGILAKRTGRMPCPTGAPYFTDASALVPGFDNVPTVVIGPGEAAQCHQTDEFCFIDHIVEASNIYSELIQEMCK